MRVCGIELKANSVVVAIVEKENNQYIDTKIKKLELTDDEDQRSIKEFFEKIEQFLQEYQIDTIHIKKRSKKGNFAGGAVTFKLESLIQLNSKCEVKLISAQTISTYEKKQLDGFPNTLNKYQQQAYIAALIQ